MNELEKNMAKTISEKWGATELHSNETIAKSILSLPAGMVAKRECDCSFNPLNKKATINPDCPKCHGTGFISRELTIGEVVEQYERCVNAQMFIDTLPTGERVEVKEGR
jgi:hypothetical protein